MSAVDDPAGVLLKHAVAGVQTLLAAPAANISHAPELAPLSSHIALWSDRYAPPPEQANDALANYPYLGEALQFQERETGLCMCVENIHVINQSALLSLLRIVGVLLEEAPPPPQAKARPRNRAEVMHRIMERSLLDRSARPAGATASKSPYVQGRPFLSISFRPLASIAPRTIGSTNDSAAGRTTSIAISLSAISTLTLTV